MAASCSPLPSWRLVFWRLLFWGWRCGLAGRVPGRGRWLSGWRRPWLWCGPWSSRRPSGSGSFLGVPTLTPLPVLRDPLDVPDGLSGFLVPVEVTLGLVETGRVWVRRIGYGRLLVHFRGRYRVYRYRRAR